MLRALLIMAVVHCGSALAAASVDTVPVDLLPLIQEAASDPSRFAVNVPHRVSTASSGVWTTTGATRTWSYAVRIREAVSLSFHAPSLALPPSAVLTVRGATTTTTYRAADAGQGDFWSRIQPGDALEFTLEVSAAELPQVLLEISSFQAGFRGLSPDVQSHAYIRRVHAMAAGDPDTPCVENYACHVTPLNSPPAQATVALSISNTFLCTGTLINNTAQDNTPYVLTARHCQNGRYGGGSPGAAAFVTVYWNARSDCGVPLQTVLYSPNAARQTGATTVVEQEDMWLIQLDASPVVDDAQLAGFDASGSPIVGGYTIHHALAFGKQITRWFGQSLSRTLNGVLGSSFTSHMLDTVNDLGASGPGASGSALFSQNNQVVGVMSLGRVSDSISGYGACPAPTPTAPNGTNHEASFNSLAATWNSTDDSTVSTGSRTLKSVLDPGNTGSLSVGSKPARRLTFNVSGGFAQLNLPVTLTWNAPNATQCTASGGPSGGNWGGTFPSSGSRQVTSSDPIDITYRMRCDFADGSHVSGSLLLHWRPPPSVLILYGSFRVWATRPAELTWESNQGPCAIAGGALALANLPANGTVTTTSGTPGDVVYTLTCGLPGFTSTRQHNVSYSTPSLDFAVSGARRQLGQSLELAWASDADTCVPTGGSPDDGWATTSRIGQGMAIVFNMNTVGTFDYGLNCIAGPISVQKSARVVVDTSPAFVTLVPDKTSVIYSRTPADFVDFRFSTNLSQCSLDMHGFPLRHTALVAPQPHFIDFTDGEWILAPDGPGTFTLSMNCLGAVGTPSVSASASATVTFLPPPPPTVTMHASANRVAPGGQFTIDWSTTYALECIADGGASVGPLQAWGGNAGINGSEVMQTAVSDVGNYVFSLECRSLVDGFPPARASIVVTVGSPNLSLYLTTSSPALGTSFEISWAEPQASSCSASGGGANGTPWTGSLATSGTVTQTASRAGQHTYTLTCVVNGVSTQTSLTVTVPSPPSSGSDPGSGGSGGSSSSGGGGAVGIWELLLATLLLARSRERLSPRIR